MSFDAFKCASCGWREFDPAGECPQCGGRMKKYRAGAPPKRAGAPNVIGDQLARHMDYSLGEEVSSKSERRRKYAAAGLNETTFGEVKAKRELRIRDGTGFSYAGQRNHRSTAEMR